MPKSKKYLFFLLWNRTYKFLFLSSIFLMALYPITDAYVDWLSLSSSSITDYLNDPDDAVSTTDLKLNDCDSKTLNHACGHNQTNSQQASLKKDTSEVPSKAAFKSIQISKIDIKSHQGCRPLSSDLSPPVL